MKKGKVVSVHVMKTGGSEGIHPRVSIPALSLRRCTPTKEPPMSNRILDGAQTPSGYFGGEQNLLLLRRIKPSFLGLWYRIIGKPTVELGRTSRYKRDPCAFHILVLAVIKIKVKVKQSRYRPGVAQRVPGS